MSRSVLRTVLALVGLYVGGVVIGGVIAIVAMPSTGIPVAVASPTPSAVVPTSASSPTMTPAKPVATPTPTPPATGTPTPEPTETPNIEPTPPPETPTPAAETPSPPATQAVADPGNIEAFIEELGRAISRGTDRFLFENLHPAVLDRYGEQQCRQYTSTTRSAGLSLEYLSANGPEPWDWKLDDRTTPIPDSWTVSVIWREPGLEEARDIHIAPSDATWRWFTDCGDPLT